MARLDDRVIAGPRPVLSTLVAAAFGAGGLAMIGYGIALWAGGKPSGGVVLTVLGALAATVFGLACRSGVRALRSAGIHLSADGLDFDGRRFPWADIAGFEFIPGSPEMGDHIRVVTYSDGRSIWSKVCRRLGWFLGPSYIPVAGYVTEEAPLLDVLTQWWEINRGGN